MSSLSIISFSQRYKYFFYFLKACSILNGLGLSEDPHSRSSAQINMIDAKTFQKNNVYIALFPSFFFSNPRATEQTKTCYNKNHDARPRTILAAHLATPINHLTNVEEKRHRLKGNSVNHRGNLYSVVAF